jgi:hypothetical protein
MTLNSPAVCNIGSLHEMSDNLFTIQMNTRVLPYDKANFENPFVRKLFHPEFKLIGARLCILSKKDQRPYQDLENLTKVQGQPDNELISLITEFENREFHSLRRGGKENCFQFAVLFLPGYWRWR